MSTLNQVSGLEDVVEAVTVLRDGLETVRLNVTTQDLDDWWYHELMYASHTPRQTDRRVHTYASAISIALNGL